MLRDLDTLINRFYGGECENQMGYYKGKELESQIRRLLRLK